MIYKIYLLLLSQVKKRHSDAYGLRPSIPPTVITLDDTDSVINGSSSHTDNRGARNIDTPSPSVSSVSETLSDVSRKHKQRPKGKLTLVVDTLHTYQTSDILKNQPLIFLLLQWEVSGTWAIVKPRYHWHKVNLFGKFKFNVN